jgi:hypothetical protein
MPSTDGVLPSYQPQFTSLAEQASRWLVPLVDPGSEGRQRRS